MAVLAELDGGVGVVDGADAPLALRGGLRWRTKGGVVLGLYGGGALVPTLGLPDFTTMVSVGYVADSWIRLEESREAGGLPGLFLLKSVVLVFCVLLGLQGLALAGRSLLSLIGFEDFRPIEDEQEVS